MHVFKKQLGNTKVCCVHYHFLETQEMPRALLRFINLVAKTLCSYRLLPVSRNIEAPAFNSWFHSKCPGAFGIQHLPFLRTALSQSRNYFLSRRDFACFANTHTLHNSCCLEQSARRWESCLQVPLSRGSVQPLQLPSHSQQAPDAPAGHHWASWWSRVVGQPAVPKYCGHKEASGSWSQSSQGMCRGEAGSCVPVLAH